MSILHKSSLRHTLFMFATLLLNGKCFATASTTYFVNVCNNTLPACSQLCSGTSETPKDAGACISAAVSAVHSGGVVYFPAGTYNISAPISTDSRTILEGELSSTDAEVGRAATINWSGASAIVVNQVIGSVIRNLQLNYNGSDSSSSSPATAISVTNSPNTIIEGIGLQGGGNGILLSGSSASFIDGLEMHNLTANYGIKCVAGNFQSEYLTSAWVVTTTTINTRIYNVIGSAAQNGLIWVDNDLGCSSTNLYDAHFDGGGYGVYIQGVYTGSYITPPLKPTDKQVEDGVVTGTLAQIRPGDISMFDLTISNPQYDGIAISNGQTITFDQVLIDHAGRHGFTTSASSDLTADVSMSRFAIQNSGLEAVLIHGGAGVFLSRGKFSGSCVSASSACNGLTVSGSGIQKNSFSDLWFDESAGAKYDLFIDTQNFPALASTLAIGRVGGTGASLINTTSVSSSPFPAPTFNSMKLAGKFPSPDFSQLPPLISWTNNGNVSIRSASSPAPVPGVVNLYPPLTLSFGAVTLVDAIDGEPTTVLGVGETSVLDGAFSLANSKNGVRLINFSMTPSKAYPNYIQVTGAQNVLLSHLALYNSTGNAFSINKSSGVVMTENYIRHFTGVGVLIGDGSSNITISRLAAGGDAITKTGPCLYSDSTMLKIIGSASDIVGRDFLHTQGGHPLSLDGDASGVPSGITLTNLTGDHTCYATELNQGKGITLVVPWLQASADHALTISADIQDSVSLISPLSRGALGAGILARGGLLEIVNPIIGHNFHDCSNVSSAACTGLLLGDNQTAWNDDWYGTDAKYAGVILIGSPANGSVSAGIYGGLIGNLFNSSGVVFDESSHTQSFGATCLGCGGLTTIGSLMQDNQIGATLCTTSSGKAEICPSSP